MIPPKIQNSFHYWILESIRTSNMNQEFIK